MNKTPRYEYNLDKIEQKIDDLVKNFKDLKIVYSLKANKHPKILKKINELGIDFDVASEGELNHLLEVGVSPNRISGIGPAKTEAFIHKMLKMEIAYIVIESDKELEYIKKNQGSFSTKFSLRINPSTVSHGARVIYKSKPSQFGFDEDSIAEVLGKINGGIKIEGFHFHYGSQLKNEFVIESTLKHSLNISKKISEKFNLKLERVNIGGGFPVGYFQENVLDLMGLCENLNLGKIDYPWKNSIELGRYIVAESGNYVVSVVDIKKSHGKNFIIVDGGFSTNALITGVGHIIKKNFLITSSSNSKEKELYTVVGPSCYQQDVLLSDIELPILNIGDEISFKNCGAYGHDFSPTNFLALPKAEEIFI